MRWSYTPQQVLSNPIHLVAFGFGSGLPSVAPGTWGSVAAVPVYALTLAYCPFWLQWLLIALAFVVGVWVCGESAKRIGVKDHPGIVWDEWVGLWLTLSCLPPKWLWWGLGLLAFRVFDITKPGPIGWLDRRLDGGLGIMADDLLAGLLAGGVVWLLFLIADTLL